MDISFSRGEKEILKRVQDDRNGRDRRALLAMTGTAGTWIPHQVRDDRRFSHCEDFEKIRGNLGDHFVVHFIYFSGGRKKTEIAALRSRGQEKRNLKRKKENTEENL